MGVVGTPTKLLFFSVTGWFVFGLGQETLSPPYTCTTKTTLCQSGNAGENHLYLGSGPSTKLGKPGKRGVPGLKGEKGDSCTCAGQTEENLPTSTQATIAGGNVKGQKGEKGESTRQAEKGNAEGMNEMRKRIEKLESEISKTVDPATTTHGHVSRFPSRCSEISQSNAGDLERAVIYPLFSYYDITPYVVNCSEGGWITIQRRINGSVNFYKNWKEYADGFGNKDGEFWIGLTNIHRMTTRSVFELRIDVTLRNDGRRMHAQYGIFYVHDERNKFNLVVGDYSGNYGDYLFELNGNPFTTHDRDNDASSANCAHVRKGAWWYSKNCGSSNLNGHYSGNYFIWGQYASFSEMKIRPRGWKESE